MNAPSTQTISRRAVCIVFFVVAVVAAGCLSSSSIAQAPKPARAGLVRSSDGSPLNQVWVQHIGAWGGSLTKADGRFLLPTGKSTLLFVKDGFRPEIRVITSSEDNGGLSVVLEPEPKAAVILPSCKLQGGSPLLELQPARFRGVQLKRGGDVDFGAYDATYRYGGSVWDFRSMTGIHVQGVIPTPEWAAGLSSFTVRSLKCGDYQWFDLRGTSASGHESRWVGYSCSHVEYSNVPSPVARVFDKAIDNGCCR
jgi:hypothetical protein